MKLKRTTLDFWYKKNDECADPNSEIDEVVEWLHAQEEEHHEEEEIPMQPPPKIQRIVLGTELSLSSRGRMTLKVETIF
jgi:hypothetical protein